MAGDGGPVWVAEHGALDPLHDFAVGGAADAEGGHLAEGFGRVAVVDDGAGFAFVRRRSSRLGCSREALEDRFAVGIRAAPFGALFAFHAEKIDADACIFDAVVAGGAVSFLDLAAEVFLS